MSVRDTVNLWFQQRIATGAIARDTEAYNQAAAALPDLIAQLDPIGAQAQVEPGDTAPATGATKATKVPTTPVDPPASSEASPTA